MFCRNCGTELAYKEDPCKKCNYKRGFGVDYCPDCGAETEARDRKCTECGATLFVMRNTKPRSRFIATLLAFAIGMFGIHNFYLGYMRKGLLKLVVSVVGLILIPILKNPFTLSAPIVMGMFALVEGIQLVFGTVRVDADGNFLV
jgi:TM2 domain-containing membrane protein YozV